MQGFIVDSRMQVGGMEYGWLGGWKWEWEIEDGME